MAEREAISTADREALRELARRVADIGHMPIQEERKALWRRHNGLDRRRPLLYISPEGSWREILPPEAHRCTGRLARGFEHRLRQQIAWHELLADDTVVEPVWEVSPSVWHTGWGLEPKRIPSSAATGAWAFDPVVHRRKDLEKLRMPELCVDDEATARNVAEARAIFDGILEVRCEGVKRVSFHLMKEWTSLRGLEQVMMDMVLEPAMLEDAMTFLEEGHRRLVREQEARGVFSLNNDNTYHSSGGRGWTDELPAPGFDPDRVRPCDLWASAEAQEMAQVSPEMHERFVLQYERRLLAPFGLNGYGCCEDLTRKLDEVLRIPNLRRVSISPWADVEACAERLGRDVIFSWKPKPQHVAGEYDPEAIRAYLRHGLEATRGCVVEVILKDTHTCMGEPERFAVWSRIAREEIDRLGE